MKNLLAVCLLSLSLGNALCAQGNLQINLAQRLGNAPFALNATVSAGSYDYQFTRLDYYISEIKITHDGGQVTPLTELYLLVHPAADSIYALGSHPEIDQVEGITFSIGVDSAHNHLDPASYPPGHPLGYQSPEMHWGWSAGYRFVALEGLVGPGFANNFGIHALGDANYQTLSIATSAETQPNGDKIIHINADYSKALNAIDISSGPIVHGTTGEAASLMQNMRKGVFSAPVTATQAPGFNGSFSVAPNPVADGQVRIEMRLAAGSGYRVALTDGSGRLLEVQTPAAERRSVSLGQALEPGLYFAQLWQNERLLSVGKVVVLPR